MSTTDSPLPALLTRRPKGWRENRKDGTIACPHRDLFVCQECAATPNVVEVYGVFYWARTDDERAELLSLAAPIPDLGPCRWFALCPNDADGVVKHPILDPVPCCSRCAEKLGLDLLPA